MLILGIDPGLQKTGWGLIETQNNSLSYRDSGLVKTQTSLPLAARLSIIDEGLARVVHDYKPDVAVVEETFVNRNPASALKLGMARGIAMVVPARYGLDVFEYAANAIKKTVVGTGHASKDQIAVMVRTLLPKSGRVTADEADALAMAICHAHHKRSAYKLTKL